MARMIPKAPRDSMEDTAFAAPLAIGAVTAATGNQRVGIAMSLVFLLGGLLLLLRVKTPR